MPRSWRCTHRGGPDKSVGRCVNCGKKIIWASVNNSKKVGFWIHSGTTTEECMSTVATPDFACDHVAVNRLTAAAAMLQAFEDEQKQARKPIRVRQ